MITSSVTVMIITKYINTFMKIPNTGNLTNYIQKNRLIKIQSYKNIPDGYSVGDAHFLTHKCIS